MKLSRLLLKNYRNYNHEEIFCNDNINIFRGFNAQGKSNLLEAISYLSLASSFRGSKDIELLKWEKDYFFLEGDITDNKENHTITVGYSKDKIKRWKIDGQKKNKLIEIIGYFHSVIFSPEDLNIIKSGPDFRRQFLNRQMVQLFPDFCGLLISYNHILRQRNIVLKKANSLTDFVDQLIPWNEQLTTIGSKIIKKRMDTCQRLKPIIKDYHRQITKGEVIELKYNSLLDDEEIKKMSESEIKTVFLKKLKVLQNIEKARGISILGPHRDDLEISIDGSSARRFASQGQQRCAALALKLAELKFARQIRGDFPVLLLDDVMSELDTIRQQQLLKIIDEEVQTFITATDLNFSYKTGKTFFIKNGQIFER